MARSLNELRLKNSLRTAPERCRLDDTERYEPTSNRFIAAGTMHEHRFKIDHSVVRLANGDVLVAGAAARVRPIATRTRST